MKQDPVPKYERAMTENSEAVSAAQRARRRALIVPREHGAWGLMLVPLCTGVAAGFASAHRAWPLLVFTMATLSLFWLRTPLESLIGTGSLTTHTSRERWTALIASVCLGAVSAACLTGLMWKGRNSELLFLGAATALAFVAQAVLRMFGRRARMAAQLVGTVGLTWMVESMYEELILSQPAASADLLPNATNEDGSPTAICMKEMVGTRRLELLTSKLSMQAD
jgi:hypothetical protein